MRGGGPSPRGAASFPGDDGPPHAHSVLVLSLTLTLILATGAAPNLAFSPDEDKAYIAAVDDVSAAPWPGKIYEVPLN